MGSVTLPPRNSLLRTSLLAGLSAECSKRCRMRYVTAQSGNRKLECLGLQAAAEIEALAAQIIPSDEGPGAKEAGVVYFIDPAPATFDQDQREIYRAGLAAARATGTIASIEHTEFFEALRKHVIMGFLASPAWGGNRDQIGWKPIGFEDAGAGIQRGGARARLVPARA